MLLRRLVPSLSQVPHLAAVVLGGSYARGTQHGASDLDIGLYYREAAPFDLAETRICIPLYDPGAEIARLKREVEIYPAQLKRSVIAEALWGAEFTLLAARGDAASGDVYNTVGCLTRAAAYLTQAIFTLNEQYFLGDKRVMEVMAAFRILPTGYVQQIRKVLACPGSTSSELGSSVAQLESAWRSVVALTAGAYQPKFVAPQAVDEPGAS